MSHNLCFIFSLSACVEREKHTDERIRNKTLKMACHLTNKNLYQQ